MILSFAKYALTRNEFRSIGRKVEPRHRGRILRSGETIDFRAATMRDTAAHGFDRTLICS
jgi:hypothetical protein